MGYYTEFKLEACERELRGLSRTLPGVTLVMHAAEEDGVRWRIYARDGKAVRVEPELVWPDPPEWTED